MAWEHAYGDCSSPSMDGGMPVCGSTRAWAVASQAVYKLAVLWSRVMSPALPSGHFNDCPECPSDTASFQLYEHMRVR